MTADGQKDIPIKAFCQKQTPLRQCLQTIGIAWHCRQLYRAIFGAIHFHTILSCVTVFAHTLNHVRFGGYGDMGRFGKAASQALAPARFDG